MIMSLVTKKDLTEVTKAVRKDQATRSAPGLVAAIKSIAASSGYWSQGTICYWNDSTDKMKCERFEIWKDGGSIKWNYHYRIDEPALTRHIERALVNGAVLKIDDYAALLDGRWYGLNKEQAGLVGSRSGWSVFEPEKLDYESFREHLLSLATTEVSVGAESVAE
jgi:hypothetical protein